jgi:hypothetical protein
LAQKEKKKRTGDKIAKNPEFEVQKKYRVSLAQKFMIFEYVQSIVFFWYFKISYFFFLIGKISKDRFF